MARTCSRVVVMGRCRRPGVVVFAALLAWLLVVSTGTPAAGQELFESSLDCPSQIVAGVGVYACTVNFTNSAVTPVDNVRFRVVWETVRVTDLAPALEPDGVPNLDNPDQQDWVPVQALYRVSGPDPLVGFDTADPARQVADFDVGTVDAQAARQFEFNWSVPSAFPQGFFSVTLETFLGDEQIGDTGRQVQDHVYPVEWVGLDPSAGVVVQPYVEVGGRYMGSATVYYANGPGRSQTDARMVVQLPDLLDPADVNFELGYRAGQSAWAYRRTFATSAGAPDGDGVYRYPAAGEANAGQLVIYDPVARTVTANIGIIHSAETVKIFWDPHHLFWRLRWDGAVSSSASLSPGQPFDVTNCLTTATLTDPTAVCAVGTTTVGPEVGYLSSYRFRGCPDNPQYCADEATGAFPPSGSIVEQSGETLVVFGNDTSQTRDMVVTVPLPNTSSAGYVDDDCGGGGSGPCTDPDGTGRVARLRHVRLAVQDTLGPGVAPIAADAIRIQVSLAPADNGADLTARQVPSPAADWVTCVELIDPTGDDLSGLSCTSDMLAGVGVDADRVEEVRFVFDAMRPTYKSVHDVHPYAVYRWFGGVVWALDDDIPSSIDGVSDQTHLANMAFGTKVVADLSDFVVDETDPTQDYTLTLAGEVTRESFTRECGMSSVNENGAVPCPGGFAGWIHSVFDHGHLAFGVGNTGTIDNVSVPITLCTPIPRSFKLESPDEPEIIQRSLSDPSHTGTPVDYATFDAWTFDDGDPVTELTYCVTITGWSGVPCAFDATQSTCLAAHQSLQVRVPYRVVPGVEAVYLPDRPQPWVYNGYSDEAYRPEGSLGAGWGTAVGQWPSGEVRTENVYPGPGSWVIFGESAITLETAVIPSEAVQPESHFCYDYRIDGHAFLEGAGDVPDPDGATLPARDGVMYQWVARCDDEGAGCTRPQPKGGPSDEPPAFTAGAGDSIFYSALSFDPDAVAIWVHTDDLPTRGDATTLAANGWVQCVDFSAGDTCTDGETCAASGEACTDDVDCRALCDAAAVSGAGVDPALVRWVAVEFGDIEITDAEPRGQAPFEPNERINRPYTAFFCMTDDGSAEGDQIITVGEAHTSTLLPVYSRPVILTVGAEAPGDLLVNEIDYDQGDVDGGELIELFNRTDRAVNLGNVELRGIDGAAGGAVEYLTLELPDVELQPGDYFVVCGQASAVEDCDLDVSPDTDLLQDGDEAGSEPDAIALYWVFGDVELLIDVLSYEGDTAAPYVEGSGAGLEDDGTLSRVGLARLPDATDSNQNDGDFATACVSPGRLNVATLESCDCGNGLVESGVGETCDDRNRVDTDGCSATCQVEYGYTCSPPEGPSVCATTCGDGYRAGTEACDDGNTADGDGCSQACELETPGWSCTTVTGGAPDTTCVPLCGDGYVRGVEGCDDGNGGSGDGCSDSCQPEYGYVCVPSGSWPESTCTSTCGNGLAAANEGCDDGNTLNGDGCSASCTLELGWSCQTLPENEPDTLCEAVCGDGYRRDDEQCDDGNTLDDDGCSALCAVELGWICQTLPENDPESVCEAVCGDGYLRGDEECDDGDTSDGDGCSAFCRLEAGWSCQTLPENEPDTLCATVCGDGYVRGSEHCDDGNTDDDDGCSAACNTVEYGFDCSDTSEHLAGITTFDVATLGTGGSGYVPFHPDEVKAQPFAFDETTTLIGFDLLLRHDIDPANPPAESERFEYLLVQEDPAALFTCVNESDWRYGDPFIDLDWVDALLGDGDPSNDPRYGDFEVPLLGRIDERLQHVDLSAPFVVLGGQRYYLLVWSTNPATSYMLYWTVEVNGEREDEDGYIGGLGWGSECLSQEHFLLYPLTETYFSYPPGLDRVDFRMGFHTQPESVCTAPCGDGLAAAAEDCDDGNLEGGDGCAPDCAEETGWNCLTVTGTATDPDSACQTVCGDGVTVTGFEACDDLNLEDLDGCSSDCVVEYGYECSVPAPLAKSQCSPVCGDGLVADVELCDDGNLLGGDGCNGTCVPEDGWDCQTVVDTPAHPDTRCAPVCGDGIETEPWEECDDENRRSGDGCSSACLAEPDTQLTLVPAARTNNATPTFHFDDPANDAVSFECSEDGGATWTLCECPGADGVTPCVTETTYTWTEPVASGTTYVFAVRGFDADGNLDGTPASWAWTFDSTPPVVALTDCPDDRSAETEARFEYVELTGDVETFLCYEQSPGQPAPGEGAFSPGEWQGCASDGSEWAGPFEDSGTYAFWVAAVDSAGNQAAAESCQWTVDLQGPGTRIDRGPLALTCDPSVGDPAGLALPLTNQSGVHFDFSDPAADGGGASDTVSFECRLDPADGSDAGWYRCSCQGPLGSEDLTGLEEGDHRFEVRAVDDLANADSSPALYEFVVDQTPPETLIESGPADSTPVETAEFAFVATAPEADAIEAETIDFQCYQLVGTEIPAPSQVDWTDCGCACGDSPPCAYTWRGDLEDNQTYTLLVRAVDSAGNADQTPEAWIFTVENDGDDDGVPDDLDNCPDTENAGQGDLDGDGQGDACDVDGDGDGLATDLEDRNGNGILDEGETDPFAPDTDGDGLCDGFVASPLFDGAGGGDGGTFLCGFGEDLDTDGVWDDGETDPTDPDTDGDGLCDGQVDQPIAEGGAIVCEWGEDLDTDGTLGDGESDPLRADSDGDCLFDGDEVLGEPPSDPLDPDDPVLFEDQDGDATADACDDDIDGDGLANPDEDRDGDGELDPDETDPFAADSDGDGLCDGAVAVPLLDELGETICAGGEDTDGDGELDAGETHPLLADTDGDCVLDGVEVLSEPTSDPRDPDDPVEVPDTDGDGVGDACDLERDGDGLSDVQEDALGTSPDDPDTDDDGLCDGYAAEPIVDDQGRVVCEWGEDLDTDGAIGDGETSPMATDSDGDCFSDGEEVLGEVPSDPLDADDPVPFTDLDADGVGDLCDEDGDGDGLPNAVEDADGDGRVDPGETDPLHPDTDGDGLCDGVVEGVLAIEESTCQGGEDIDGDGRVDGGETDPTVTDSDGDCLDDGLEVLERDSDPLDADSPTSGGECVVCGDGRVEPQVEPCDDGNAEDGDGCSARCEVESRWVCQGEPTTCEVDSDADGTPDARDNCPLTVNSEQIDSDDNGVGDACEQTVVELTTDEASGCCHTAGRGSTSRRGLVSIGLLLGLLAFSAFRRRRARSRSGEDSP